MKAAEEPPNILLYYFYFHYTSKSEFVAVCLIFFHLLKMGDLPINKKAAVVDVSPWQISLKSKAEKWEHIFSNELYTDVTLSVGPTQEVIRGHRIVLILNSPVFESMLSGRWSRSSSDRDSTATGAGDDCDLLLPEDDPTIFKLLLASFYTDTPLPKSIGTDDLLQLLFLAKKYICVDISAKCVNLLKSRLTENNAVQIYESIKYSEEPELEKTVESFILSKATALCTLGEFAKLEKPALCHFLSHDELNVDEVELFNAVYKWGESEVDRRGGIETIVSVLADVLPLIRFPLMSVEEFSRNVVTRHVLSLEDTVQVYQFLTMEAPPEGKSVTEDTPPPPKVPFSTTGRRRKIFSYVFKRLKGHGFDYGRKWQNFCFQVNQEIRLVSLGLFRAVAAGTELEVGLRICDFEMGTIFAAVEEKLTSPGDPEDVFHVRFSQPVLIGKDTLYTISYIIKGGETFYKSGEPKGVELVCQGGTTISFLFQEGKVDSDMDQVPEICFQL